MKPGIEPPWPGEDPVAVAGEPEAEPVAPRPALVVGDRLHGAHLLGARRREDGLVGIGEERAPAADVRGRPHSWPADAQAPVSTPTVCQTPSAYGCAR